MTISFTIKSSLTRTYWRLNSRITKLWEGSWAVTCIEDKRTALLITIVCCLKESVVSEVPSCVLQKSEGEPEHSLSGSEGSRSHHLIVNGRPLPVRSRTSPSSILILEEHPSQSVAPEVASGPRFDVRCCEDAGFAPFGVDQRWIEFLNGVWILVSSCRVEVLDVHGWVEAENVRHFMNRGRSHWLKKHVCERWDLID